MRLGIDRWAYRASMCRRLCRDHGDGRSCVVVLSMHVRPIDIPAPQCFVSDAVKVGAHESD
jgi:hypothetical protein